MGKEGGGWGHILTEFARDRKSSYPTTEKYNLGLSLYKIRNNIYNVFTNIEKGI